MVQRCHNPNSHNWEWYGGRGITVCDRWRGENGYDNFILDMGVPPPKLTIDRVDNAKGYGPDNCKWSTWKEQAQNKRRNGGPPIDPTSLRQQAIAAGLPYSCVYQRVRLKGWSIDEALTTPNLGQGHHR